jgi:hypothetical protein
MSRVWSEGTRRKGRVIVTRQQGEAGESNETKIVPSTEEKRCQLFSRYD